MRDFRGRGIDPADHAHGFRILRGESAA